MKTLIRGMSVRMVRKSRYYRQFRGRNERLSSFLTFSGDEVIIHPAILLSVVHPVILIEMLRGSNEIKYTHTHTHTQNDMQGKNYFLYSVTKETRAQVV